MRISILTLFPEMFAGPFDASIIKRAREKKILTIDTVNIRDFASDTHRSVDDRPYGGGAGMILRVDVVDRALKSTKQEAPFDNPSIKLRTSTQGGRNSKLAQRTVLLDPQGIPFAHDKAQELSTYDHLILICGHYEGVDERIRKLVNEELSVGDYILTGGEIAAIVVVDSVARLIPGVIRSGAARTESFAQDTLEYPQYTRPERHKTWTVPQILMSGNHARIHTWRLQQSRKRTRIRRPDLIQKKKSRT